MRMGRVSEVNKSSREEHSSQVSYLGAKSRRTYSSSRCPRIDTEHASGNAGRTRKRPIHEGYESDDSLASRGYHPRVDLSETELRALRELLAREPGLEVAFAFGSRARGDASPESDLDIAVAGSEVDRYALGGRLASAMPFEIDLVDVTDYPFPLVDAVLSEGILLFERRSGAGADFRARAILETEIFRPLYERMSKAALERFSPKTEARDA